MERLNRSGAEELFELMTLMMGRYPSKDCNACFVFGRAKGDYECTEDDSGILWTAAWLRSLGFFEHIVIPNAPGGATFSGATVSTTFPGTQEWSMHLLGLGVPVTNIVVPGKHPIHTRGEGDAFVAAAKKRKWRSAIVLANPHQLARAMLGLLKSFPLHEHPMVVWPLFPQRVNWNKIVFGSQGAEGKPRHQHISDEWQRIKRYQSTGELASLIELRQYLLELP